MSQETTITSSQTSAHCCEPESDELRPLHSSVDLSPAHGSHVPRATSSPSSDSSAKLQKYLMFPSFERQCRRLLQDLGGHVFSQASIPASGKYRNCVLHSSGCVITVSHSWQGPSWKLKLVQNCPSAQGSEQLLTEHLSSQSKKPESAVPMKVLGQKCIYRPSHATQ